MGEGLRRHAADLLGDAGGEHTLVHLHGRVPQGAGGGGVAALHHEGALLVLELGLMLQLSLMLQLRLMLELRLVLELGLVLQLLDGGLATRIGDERGVAGHHAEVGVGGRRLLLLLLGHLLLELMLLLGGPVQVEQTALGGQRPAEVGRVHRTMEILQRLVAVVGGVEGELRVGNACLKVGRGCRHRS